MEYKIGDIVETKKNHPCGGNLWEITGIGVKFRMKCKKCEHIILLDRQQALKRIKNKKQWKRNE